MRKNCWNRLSARCCNAVRAVVYQLLSLHSLTEFLSKTLFPSLPGLLMKCLLDFQHRRYAPLVPSLTGCWQSLLGTECMEKWLGWRLRLYKLESSWHLTFRLWRRHLKWSRKRSLGLIWTVRCIRVPPRWFEFQWVLILWYPCTLTCRPFSRFNCTPAKCYKGRRGHNYIMDLAQSGN